MSNLRVCTGLDGSIPNAPTKPHRIKDIYGFESAIQARVSNWAPSLSAKLPTASRCDCGITCPYFSGCGDKFSSKRRCKRGHVIPTITIEVTKRTALHPSRERISRRVERRLAKKIDSPR